MSAPLPADGTTSIDLVLPPDPTLLRIVRLVASGLASLADLDLDGVEEVRVAADELVSTMIEASTGDPVTVRLSIAVDHVGVEASTPVANGQLVVDPMVDRVLDAVSSRHEWRTEDGVGRGRVERSR